MLVGYVALVVVPLALFIVPGVLIPARVDEERTRPFECGFDGIKPRRVPFSSQFFIISVVFLVFDIELAILVPLVWFTNASMVTLTIFLFL